MRIFDADPNRASNPSTPGVFGVEHKGKELHFNNGKTSTRTLNIPSSTNDVAVLRHINLVFASMSEEEQLKIFMSYERIRDMFDSIMDPNILLVRIKSEVNAIYKVLDYDFVCHVVSTKDKILTPTRIVSNYEDMEISERSQDLKNYRVTTYLKDDYLKLVYMAIYIKAMIPIWAEYIKRMDCPSGKTTYRDYQAIGLISGTDIVTLPAFERLREYVSANVININRMPGNRVPNTVSAILGGLGSSELPDWLVAKTVIRKLILIELSTNDDNSSVISIIYKNVESELNSLGRKFSGPVSYKKKPKETESSDDKSLLEIYKMQQEHSDGDNTITTMYGEKPIRIILAKLVLELDQPVSLSLARENYDVLKRTNKLNLSDAQFTLLGWISHKVIHYFGLDYQDRDSIFKFQAIAMAYLETIGYHDLALLLTATEVKDEEGFLLGGLASKNLVSKNNMAALIEVYPYYHERSAKDSMRQKNLGCVGLNLVCDELVRCDWIPCAPKALLDMSSQVDSLGLMTPPSNIRDQVSEVLQILNK